MQSNQSIVSRVTWVLIALLALVTLFAGIAPYTAELQRGTIGVSLKPNAAGEMTMSPLPGREAALAGVQENDVLLTINNVALPKNTSIDETIELMRGPQGEPINVTVRTANGTEKSLTIVRSELFLSQLAATGLSANFYQNYHIVLSLLIPLVFMALGAWVIWKNGKSMAFLVGFVLLLMPYSLNLTDLAFFGTSRIGFDWDYSLMRAAGLLGIALFLLLFPSGKFFPTWARWLAIIVGIWMLPFYVSQIITGLIPTFIVDWAWILIFAIGIIALVLRFRAPETPHSDREALRKVLLAGVITLAAYVLLWLLNNFLPGQFFTSPAGIWFELISLLAWDAVAVFLGVQMLRASAH